MNKPNIIYIYADDLGRGMLSCYDQRIIKTPNIDKLSDEGLSFTNFYGTAFCAPARASLICGIHDAHAGRWNYTPAAYYKKMFTDELTYDEVQEILQNVEMEARANDQFIGTVARQAGYVTGQIGKLDWGFATTPKSVISHGWDYHCGYYDHIMCHGYYPPFVFENGNIIELPGNTDPHCGRPSYKEEGNYPGKIVRDMTGRAIYSQDYFDEKIKDFIHENKKQSFFLYHPSQLPHGPTFYPEHHEQVKDLDYLTDIEKEYASMVLRLDETVGKIVKEIELLGLTDNTIILFASDNGHQPNYQQKGRCMKTEDLDGNSTNDIDKPFRTETCGDVFNGNDSMAGHKFTNWDGGCKIPFIVKWPNHVPQKSVCNMLFSNYDTLATMADLLKVEKNCDKDGISYLDAMLGKVNAREHDYVVFCCSSGPAIVTKEGWKLRVYFPRELRKTMASCNLTLDKRVVFQLYNLKDDYQEKNNLAKKYSEKMKELKYILLKECDGNLYNGSSEAHFTYPDYPLPSWAEFREDII